MIKFHQCRSTFIISFFFKYCDNNTIYKEIDWIPISKFSSSKNWRGFISRFHLASKNIKEKIFLAIGDASTIPSSGFNHHLPSFLLINRGGGSATWWRRKWNDHGQDTQQPRKGNPPLENTIPFLQHGVVRVEIAFMVRSVPERE